MSVVLRQSVAVMIFAEREVFLSGVLFFFGLIVALFYQNLQKAIHTRCSEYFFCCSVDFKIWKKMVAFSLLHRAALSESTFVVDGVGIVLYCV